MTRDEIRTMIRDILADLVDDPGLVLTDGTVAADLAEWDSINHVRLLITIEQELGFRFTNEEAEGLSNVGELVDLVQTKLKPES
jgi:acyl carrier protein